MNESEIQGWKDFALHLRRLARWDLEKIDQALRDALVILPGLESRIRAALLKIGQGVAERSSKLAVAFLRTAPESLRKIDPAFQSVFVNWAEILMTNSRETLIVFFEKGPEILSSLSREDGAPYLEIGVNLAKKDWVSSFKYFINLNIIIHRIKTDKLNKWYEEGLPLIGNNPPAAMAYYAMESKQSQDKAEEDRAGVSFEIVATPLKILVQAMTGRGMGLRPLKDLVPKNFQPSSLWPFTDGESIFLPEVVEEFPAQVLNFAALKLSAAHQAGQVEFGSFDFNLSALSDCFPPEVLQACLRGIVDKEKPISPLEAFLNLFPKRELAKDLFSILEGGRIDACLKRHYRGLRKDLANLIPEIMKRRPKVNLLPLQEAFVETLLRLGSGEEIGEELPWPIPAHFKRMASSMATLAEDGATVQDSARLTVVFYRWLASIPNLRFSAVINDVDSRLYSLLTRPLKDSAGMDFASQISAGEEPYNSLLPISYRGEMRPDLVQKKLRIREIQNLLKKMGVGVPLSAEALRDLWERGIEMEVEIFDGEGEDVWQGLLATDLKNAKKAAEARHKLRKRAQEGLKSELNSLLSGVAEEIGVKFYFYDEWDYHIHDYRVDWCRLREKVIEEASAEFVPKTLEAYFDLIREVRRQFKMLKPERFKKIPHLERGEEIDLDAAIEASVDRKAGYSPSEKIYIEKNRKDRDFSTLFLLDLSASTDEKLNGKDGKGGRDASSGDKKVIDVEKESLVVMAEALEELGDEYAIFGFSGYGRKEVDFFTIKDFPDEYGAEVKNRIGGLKAQRSTRMGPAIRHAITKLANREQKIKNIILISDGYPQDYDYGEDRTSKEYALEDTMMALEEAARQNIHTFCITVDRAGYDYLRKMCHPSRYLVIEETRELPRELPKIYRRLTT
jgi:nitric oxide reductase NorD protein